MAAAIGTFLILGVGDLARRYGQREREAADPEAGEEPAHVEADVLQRGQHGEQQHDDLGRLAPERHHPDGGGLVPRRQALGEDGGEHVHDAERGSGGDQDDCDLSERGDEAQQRQG